MVNWNFSQLQLTLTFTATRYTHDFDRICVFIQMNECINICMNVGMMISWTEFAEIHSNTHTQTGTHIMYICYVYYGRRSRKQHKEQQLQQQQRQNITTEEEDEKRETIETMAKSFVLVHAFRYIKLLLLIKVHSTFRSF